jgi:spore coat protein U-like protein
MNRKNAFSAISAGAVFAAFAAAGTASFSAQAAPITKNASFLVSLIVSSDCSISANPLPFGTADSTLVTLAMKHDTNLSVTCTTGTTYTVALDAGTVTGSAVTGRLMAGTGTNTSTVQYQLYSDSGYSSIWGDTSSNWVSGVGTGVAVSVPVYGEVPAQPIPAADNYSTTETATITF